MTDYIIRAHLRITVICNRFVFINLGKLTFLPEYHPFVHDEVEDAGEDEGNDVAIGRYEQAQKRGNSMKL